MITGTSTWLKNLAALQKQAIYVLCFGDTCLVQNGVGPAGPVPPLPIPPPPPGQKMAIIYPCTATAADPYHAGSATAFASCDGAGAGLSLRFGFGGEIPPHADFSDFDLAPHGITQAQLTSIWGVIAYSYFPGTRSPSLGAVGMRFGGDPDFIGADDHGPGGALVSLYSPTYSNPDPTAVDLSLATANFEIDNSLFGCTARQIPGCSGGLAECCDCGISGNLCSELSGTVAFVVWYKD